MDCRSSHVVRGVVVPTRWASSPVCAGSRGAAHGDLLGADCVAPPGGVLKGADRHRPGGCCTRYLDVASRPSVGRNSAGSGAGPLDLQPRAGGTAQPDLAVGPGQRRDAERDVVHNPDNRFFLSSVNGADESWWAPSRLGLVSPDRPPADWGSSGPIHRISVQRSAGLGLGRGARALSAAPHVSVGGCWCESIAGLGGFVRSSRACRVLGRLGPGFGSGGRHHLGGRDVSPTIRCGRPDAAWPRRYVARFPASPCGEVGNLRVRQ
jgi:hypothetical protein